MTIIAYKDGVMAADKRSLNCMRPATVTKIFRVDGAIIAVSGELVKGLEMIEWIKDGCISNQLPAFQASIDGYVPVLVANDGGLYLFEHSHVPMRIEDPYFAIGSGRDYALMAMHLGLSAEQAVIETCRLTVCCGDGVDVLSLK